MAALRFRFAPPAASHGAGGNLVLAINADHSVGAGQLALGSVKRTCSAQQSRFAKSRSHATSIAGIANKANPEGGGERANSSGPGTPPGAGNGASRHRNGRHHAFRHPYVYRPGPRGIAGNDKCPGGRKRQRPSTPPLHCDHGKRVSGRGDIGRQRYASNASGQRTEASSG
jgi:hypothetical protein